MNLHRAPRWLLVVLLAGLAACRRAPATTPHAVVTPTRAAPTATPILTPTHAAATTPTAVPALITPEVTPTPTPLYAPEWPDPTGLVWQPVIEGLTQPTGLAAPRDGSGRLFVLERGGRIWVLQHGRLGPEPFLDIRDRVGSRASEQGLLGLAFHPRFAQNGEFFVNYTDHQGNTVVARYRLPTPDAEQADPASEEVLLRVEQPYGNHNGGHLAFGPDGYLYIGLGDGGAAGDPEDRAQNLHTLLGKMLRLDVDAGPPYGIPPDNPWADGQDARPEIWAWGLRNPWRYAFDRATGTLYIADVGQDAWEEVNVWPADRGGGANFGWDYFEGTHPYEDTPPPGLELVFPVVEYGHDQGCSVTGGEVYRGRALPEMTGVYVYGDFCTGRIWGLLPRGEGWESRLLWETPFAISTFGLDEQGELYLADYRTGRVLQLVRGGTEP